MKHLISEKVIYMSQRFTTTPVHKQKCFALQVRNVDRFTEMQLGTDGMFLCMFLSKLVHALYCHNWSLQYQLLVKPSKYSERQLRFENMSFFKKNNFEKNMHRPGTCIAITLSGIGAKTETGTRTRTMGTIVPSPYPV